MPAKAQYDKRFGHLAFRDRNRASAYTVIREATSERSNILHSDAEQLV